MPEPPIANVFPPVGESESGQKLLRFLERRLRLPQPLLHRWLRTGQIRLNGKRAKPFEAVQTGDIVRLPPFVQKLAVNADAPELPAEDMDLPPLLGHSDDIWAFIKPAGIAVQGGTNTSESLAAQFARAYASCSYVPAPAHRLDKQTSGILLVGATFSGQQKLQRWFREGKIHKEYLAWTFGRWPFETQKLIRHYLGGQDRIEAYKKPGPGRAEGICVVRPLAIEANRSLLQIRLFNGRKRQIRAQLAAIGTPVHGDSRYGAKPGSILRLHASRIILPDGSEFLSLPPWGGDWNVPEMPDPVTLNMMCRKPDKNIED